MWRELAFCGAVTVAVVCVGLGLQRVSGFRAAQYGSNQELAAGKLLIAKPDLADPNFAETVVLLLQYDTDKGTLGVILNRRTKTSLSKIFPEIKGAKDDPVYAGGPVETTTAQALVRSGEKPDGGVRVFGNIYASGKKELIEKSVASGASPSEFRLYVGYAGWSSGQLEREVAIGGWSVLRASASLVFDDNPDTLWQRLNHDTETSIASVGRVGLPPLL